MGDQKIKMNFYKGLNSNVKKFGISKASKILIKKLGLLPKVNLRNFPKDGPVLVYSNHPTGLDPFLLAGVLGRGDFLFLGDKYHTLKGNEVANHVAPTMPTQRFFWEFIKRRPTNWLGFVKMRMTDKFDYKKAKLVNKVAIEKIVNNVIDGHLSLVFPSGGEYEFLPWKKGLNKIIKIINNKKVKFTLYKISIKNFSEFKLILHFLTFKKLFSDLLIVGKKVSTIIK